LWATTYKAAQWYSRVEHPQSIARRTHKHGPGWNSREVAANNRPFLPFDEYSLSIQEKEVFLMDKKQTITTERKIGKITYLVQALPSEKATDTIHKKIEKLIVKDLQKKPGNPGFLASE
jgi:hypothetical protein